MMLGSVIVFGCFIIGSFGNDLEFLEEPQSNIEVTEGEIVVLRCKAPPGILVHWELGGDPLDISPRRFMNGTDLIIARVFHGEDDGPFTCVITDTDTGSELTSGPALLDITWISDLAEVKVIGEIPTSTQDSLHLRCHVHGTEPIKIQWFRDSDGLLTVGKVNTTGRNMLVTGVTPADNGVYRCIATNKAGSVHSHNRIVVNVPDDNWAQIVVIPQDVIAKRGSNVIFNCIYQFADAVEWYFKQNGPLGNSTKFSILPNGSLSVNDATEKEEGLYLCVGIKGENTETIQSFSASLKLAYLQEPDYTTLTPFTNDSLRIVGEGENAEIGCFPPDGFPKPTVSWSNGIAGQIFIVKRASQSHAREYSCIITNMADTKKVPFKLAVTRIPSITMNPQSQTVDEGAVAVLRCEFLGSPKFTQIQWIKDNLPVKGARFHENKSYLNITNVLPSDQGDYICQITTKPFLPVYSTPATITVTEKLKFSPRPINTNLELDTVRKVHCRAQGAVPPAIKWIKLGEENFPDHISEINGTLYFNKVKFEDKGNYTCIASNIQGTINVTIEVEVVVSPKFAVLPQNPTEVLEGESLLLDCVAEGNPMPAIHWDKNSNVKNLDSSRYITLENGSLYINEVQGSDEGQYGCTAGNSGGLKRHEVTLLVKANEAYQVGDGEDEDAVMSKTVAVTLGAASAYMILVIGLMAYCRCRSRRNKQALRESLENEAQAEAGHSGERKMCNGEAGHSDGEATATSHHSASSSKAYGKLVVTRENLTDMMVLGQGQFGDVCLARFDQGDEINVGTVVMVKTLQETRDEGILHEFKRELDLFGRVDHANVAKLVGLCREQYPHFMILQYTDWGDLKQMLMATKGDRKDKPKPPKMTPKIMMTLVKGLCLGMEHISNHRLVHRDLAARNCLVTSDLSVKVSLSSLSKDVYRREYFLHRNKLLPIRWMAPEVVPEDDYSTKSDVYSFGVTAWEIFSCGDMPHTGRSDQEVLSNLSDCGGLQLVFNETTPEPAISLITECRSPNPSDRPPFSSLVIKISDIISQLE